MRVPGDRQRPIDTMHFVVQMLVALHSFEIWSKMGEIPIPLISRRLLPSLEVRWLAAHVNHGIDRTSTPKDSRCRDNRFPTTELRLRHRFVETKMPAPFEKLDETRWHPEERTLVSLTRFKKQHSGTMVPNQTSSRNAAGTTPADNNIIKTLSQILILPSKAYIIHHNSMHEYLFDYLVLGRYAISGVAKTPAWEVDWCQVRQSRSDR